jgi:predicted small lipoprotein YifL
MMRALILGLALVLAGCGADGPPVPPGVEGAG